MRTARGILAGLALVFAGALVLEVAVRLVAPQQLVVIDPDLYQPDSPTGWSHRPGVRTIVNTGDGPVRFRTDANGSRVRWDAPGDGPKGDVRILALGDSFLEATAVEAEGTIAEILRERLSADLGRDVAVDNTGVGGWDVNQFLMQARRSLARDRYDFGLVFLDGPVEEAVASFKPRSIARPHALRLPRSLRPGEWVNALLYPVNDFLKARSHLYVLAKRLLRVPLSRAGLSAEGFPDFFDLSFRDRRDWDVTTGVCAAIRDEFAARGAPVVFVLVPYVYQVDPAAFDRFARSFSVDRSRVDLEQPGRVLGERFRAASLTLLDPLPEMRDRSAQGTKLYGVADDHLNAAGQRAIAEAVLPAVRSALAGRAR